MSSSQFLMTQLFLFFGDHGMTMAGDHGGETPLETDSALLVYSPKPLFEPRTVRRINIYMTSDCKLTIANNF